MKKLIIWFSEHGLAVFSIFLFILIPLYPKLPLVDIKNTWVYVRVEDFLVFGAMLFWVKLLYQKKVTLQTPLTMPILLFWLVGVISTLHGVVVLFPSLANVFPNVALLSFLRRVEYMSLFFVAYAGARDRFMPRVTAIALTTTVLVASLYGLGQKYFGFPAFLTMNEEFAKGTAITLSSLSRVPSTFAGHYDFAAFLVLTIPIMFSFMLWSSSWTKKVVFLGISLLGLIALVMTVSRISLLALGFGIICVVFMKNRRLFLGAIPVALVIFMGIWPYASSLVSRFGSTVSEVDILVDATNGHPLGKVRLEPNTYFQNKVVHQQFFESTSDIGKNNVASPSGIIIPYAELPPVVALLVAPTASTGEDLPQGTGYINLSLSPVTRRLNQFYYEQQTSTSDAAVHVQIINGPYLIKKTLAYDLSFTTRFQGEWPNALAAFRRNIFIGSGYGSVSLAVDNSYLRMLGETGSLGFISFFSIFVVFGLFAHRSWGKINSPLIKSLIIGFAGGVGGLLVNAVFIDVFEASKIAFVLWILFGLLLGFIDTDKSSSFSIHHLVGRIVTSSITISIFFIALVSILFGGSLANFPVGDDFTWFRWASQTKPSEILTLFTDAAGFFWRPGAKLYFMAMYKAFWLNQTMYHAISVALHMLVILLVYTLVQKLTHKRFLSATATLFFALMSGYAEVIFWISATGFLFTTALTLVGVLSYIRWEEVKKARWAVAAFTCTLLAPMFHELGIVTPLLYLTYSFWMSSKKTVQPYWYLIATPVYLFIRFLSGSHWSGGDYSYNLAKLPLNMVGNAIGYFGLLIIGPQSVSVYDTLRSLLRTHIVAGVIGLLAGVGYALYVVPRLWKQQALQYRGYIGFSLSWIGISLLPFLPLGNIAPRYSYMAGIGVAMLLAYWFDRLYSFLHEYGVTIARSVSLLIVLVFSLFQMISVYKLADNWHEAGEKVQRFIMTMDAAYEDEWATLPIQFHFVNIPIRNGDAWVFPVGLTDALWFTFHNPTLLVYSHRSSEEALSSVEYGNIYQKIFVFDDSGAVGQIKKKRSQE